MSTVTIQPIGGGGGGAPISGGGGGAPGVISVISNISSPLQLSLKLPYADLRVTPKILPPVERLHDKRGSIEYGKFYPLKSALSPQNLVFVTGRIRNTVSILNPPDTTQYFLPIKALDFRSNGATNTLLPATITPQFMSRPVVPFQPRQRTQHPKPPRPAPYQSPTLSKKARKPKKLKGVQPIPSGPPPPSAPSAAHQIPSFPPPISSTHRVLSDEKGWKDIASSSSNSSHLWHVMVGAAGTPQQWMPFDTTISQAIERAFHEQLESVGYYFNQYHYKLIFGTMKQTNLTTLAERTIKRCLASVDPNATAIIPKPLTTTDSSRVMALVQMLASSHPSYWTQSEIQHAIQSQGKVVPCLDTDPEFSMVSQMIQSSHQHYSVVRVSKIINPVQYFRYVHWCDTLRFKFPTLNLNEQYAFHGTSEGSLGSIVKDGFKYRFNGRHMHGRGSYFALKANYCLDPLFASPNAAGERHVLVTRVCVGKITQGLNDMMPAADDSYQTAVDNVHNPSMYVTFHDDQTYPEFLAVLK